MVTPQRGEIWWAELGEPGDSEPGYRRPVLVIQDDRFNRSNLATVIVLSMTTNRRFQALPGNVLVTRADTTLARDSVVNVTQLAAIDKAWLDEFVVALPPSIMAQVDTGLSLVLGLG